MGRHRSAETPPPHGPRVLVLTIVVLSLLTLAGVAIAGGFGGSPERSRARNGDAPSSVPGPTGSAGIPTRATRTGSTSVAPTRVGPTRSRATSVAPTSTGTACVTVHVVADPREVPWVATLATAYSEKRRRVDGRCVHVGVTGLAATGLPGAVTGAEATRPDAWLATSRAAVATARTDETLAGPLTQKGTSIASSPLVVGVPTDLADSVAAAVKGSSLIALGLAPAGWGTIGHADWGPMRLAMPDPAHDSTGMSALLAAAAGGNDLSAGTLRSDSSRRATLGLARVTRIRTDDTASLLSRVAAAASSRDLATGVGLPLVSESGLAGYTRERHTVPLTAVYPFDGSGALTYPLVPMTGDWVGTAERAGIADFRSYLLSAPVQVRLGAFGLRSAAGVISGGGAGLRADAVPPRALSVDPVVISTARQEWTALSRPVSALALIDVSGSMSDQVPGAGATKLDLATRVARSSLAVFADSDHIGLRTFSTDPDGVRPWRELVSLGPAAGIVGGRDRRSASVAAYRGLRANGGTALYNSIRDAVGAAQRAYTPGALNTVIVLTDGRNRDAPGSITLAQLTAALQSVANSARPVHVITIGYGADVDAGALTAVAEASGGTSFTAPDPRTIDKAFVSALGALSR